MVRIIGHRGAGKLWAENSVTGFEETSRLGIEGVEFDVHLTADEELVVLHDPRIDRTMNGSGAVCDMTLRQIREFRLKDTDGDIVPTLAEVLEIFRDTGYELQIELKVDAFGRPYPTLADRVMVVATEMKVADRCTLTSFVPSILEDASSRGLCDRFLLSANLASAQQFGGLFSLLTRVAAMRNCLAAVHKDLLRFGLSECLRILGAVNTGVWAPNASDELDFWIQQPIHQVTTDRPDIALRSRNRNMAVSHAK